MNLTFRPKSFFPTRARNAAHHQHFLLEHSYLMVVLTFADSSYKRFTPRRNSAGEFVLTLDPADIPNDPSGHKKLIVRASIDYSVEVRRSKIYTVLRIEQEFSLSAYAWNNDVLIDYRWVPFAWTHSATRAVRKANFSTHPLLDLSKLGTNIIEFNNLVVDLTEVWAELHEKNDNFRMFQNLTNKSKVTFKVFAYLGGHAFIWFSVIPAYLASTDKASAHVFYSPWDYGPLQNIKDDRSYLFRNSAFEGQEGAGADDRFNGNFLWLGYLLPPVDDVAIATLNPDPAHFTKAELVDRVTQERRNVVNFHFVDPPRDKRVTLEHWNIGAGFEKAFYGDGAVKPLQLLLMPQAFSSENGDESKAQLRTILDAMFRLLQSNTPLLAHSQDELVTRDKSILSAYSESGLDLWASSKENIDDIKAIIGIEPNNTNPDGKKIIPLLLKKKIKVFLVGQHEGFEDHYRPKLDRNLLDQIRFLPQHPLVLLKYPPDPSVNSFVKYRVARVTSETLDPLMRADEVDVLKDLARRRRPITGTAAIPVIFRWEANKYHWPRDEIATFYDHNFALTGGQDMTLADPNDFYNKPVTYRTFFQQAVEEIEQMK